MKVMSVVRSSRERGTCVPGSGRLLEQIVERGAGAARPPGPLATAVGCGRARSPGGRRFAFHCRAWLELHTHILDILRRNPRGHRLVALERRTRIEIGTLCAGVESGSTTLTSTVRTPRRCPRQLIATSHALHDFSKSGHAERLRRNRRLASRRVFLFDGRAL